MDHAIFARRLDALDIHFQRRASRQRRRRKVSRTHRARQYYSDWAKQEICKVNRYQGTKVPNLDLVKLFALREPRCILQPLLSSCNWWRFMNRENLGKSHGAGIPAKTNLCPPSSTKRCPLKGLYYAHQSDYRIFLSSRNQQTSSNSVACFT